jgi:hypothetical protein
MTPLDLTSQFPYRSEWMQIPFDSYAYALWVEQSQPKIAPDVVPSYPSTESEDHAMQYVSQYKHENHSQTPSLHLEKWVIRLFLLLLRCTLDLCCTTESLLAVLTLLACSFDSQ